MGKTHPLSHRHRQRDPPRGDHDDGDLRGENGENPCGDDGDLHDHDGDLHDAHDFHAHGTHDVHDDDNVRAS